MSEQIIRDMLTAIGENPDREGLLDTPKRVVKSWKEIYGGYNHKPEEILQRVFSDETYDQMILLKDIDFWSNCEHHLQPFFGKVHIAYIPNNQKVVGLSKLARLVECFSRRLQIQERLTQQIADTFNDIVQPKGVAVLVEGKHFCMVARGVQKQNGIMTTTALRGVFMSDASCRSEFFGALKR